MAYIRITTKLPSGIEGWYIYYDVNGKMMIESPTWKFHTFEDVKVIREILNECVEDMEKKKEREK